MSDFLTGKVLLGGTCETPSKVFKGERFGLTFKSGVAKIDRNLSPQTIDQILLAKYRLLKPVPEPPKGAKSDPALDTSQNPKDGDGASKEPPKDATKGK